MSVCLTLEWICQCVFFEDIAPNDEERFNYTAGKKFNGETINCATKNSISSTFDVKITRNIRSSQKFCPPGENLRFAGPKLITAAGTFQSLEPPVKNSLAFIMTEKKKNKS